MNQKHMTRLAAAALAGLIGTASAQPAAGVAEKTAGDATAALIEQRKQYAEVLTAESAKCSERLSAIIAQMQELDKDIESRVDRIVALLATVKDSADSRGRSMRSKDKAIQGLRKSISFYVRERDRRNQERAAGGTPASKEGLAEDVTALNMRIEKRVGQILSLANSMTQQEEFSTYERYRNDENGYNAETKEFERFEKDADGSAKTKADVIQELKASIDKQSGEIKDLHDKLLITGDAQRKERIRSQIDEKEEIVAERRKQLESFLSAAAPDAKAVSAEGAFEIDKLLADMTLDLQRDFRKLQQLVAERNDAQARARNSQERLNRFLRDGARAAPADVP